MSHSPDDVAADPARIRGLALVYGDDVDTDQIIPARYLVTTDPKELAEGCMAGSPKPLPDAGPHGTVVIAGRNFGCGSSREHAPLALLGAGVEVVVAASFARIFFRNAVNVGLRVVEARGAHECLSDGELVQVDPATGRVESLENRAVVEGFGLPGFVQAIADAGGLVPWAAARIAQRDAAGDSDAQEVAS